MADYLIQDTTLDAIADAINAKTGGSSAMTPAQMATAIGNIQTGGGGDITLTTLNVIENGTVNAPSGTAYKKVVTDVPNSYAAGDEGKVVSNGSLVSQTAHAEVTANGTYDTTLNNSVMVNVPQGTTPTGTKTINISANGTTTEDVTAYANAQIVVEVPIPTYQTWQGGSY